MRAPEHLGPTMLLLVSGVGIGAVLWGVFIANPDITVVQFDAGPLDDFAIGQMNEFPDEAVYVYGLPDGRIRALDGRVESSGCEAVWRGDDERGSARNPGGHPGAFEDPCTGALWSAEGNAVSGTEEPLRTPQVTLVPGGSGGLHVSVELVNHPLGER